MITKELIARFFKDEITTQEREQVLAYFHENPDEFARFLDQSEWENFEPEEQMEPALASRIFNKVNNQTIQRKSKITILVRMAVAASILLIISLGWMFLDHKNRPLPIAKTIEKNKDSSQTIARHEVNRTGKERVINLEDGSLVVLSNNSEIEYQLPFTTERKITLVGKAFFKVAKDRTKPFSVTSGEITTIAVGTEFTVSSYRSMSQITVRLYEGKVVIRATDNKNKRLTKDIYLLPGQKFVYGNEVSAKVIKFKITSNAAPEQIMRQEQINDNLSLPENTEVPFFMFNNQLLANVLDDLGVIYEVNIDYKKDDVQNIYFTGKYNRSESLETILQRICVINSLKFTRKDSLIVVSK